MNSQNSDDVSHASTRGHRCTQKDWGNSERSDAVATEREGTHFGVQYKHGVQMRRVHGFAARQHLWWANRGYINVL